MLRPITLPGAPAAQGTPGPTVHPTPGSTTGTQTSGTQPSPTRRRVLVHAPMVGAAAALAACGQAQSSGDQPRAPASEPGARGTVQFWQWGVVYNDGFDTLVKEHNARGTGVTVELTPAANGVSYWDKLTSALAGNVGPDVFLMNSNARTWATKGLLRPLDDLIKRDKAAEASNGTIHRNFREWYEVGGKQTGWGWDYSTIATAYNVTHLREAGLKAPSELGEQWDWDTFLEYAQKLNRPGVRWGVWSNPDYQTGWLNFVRANGGDYFSEDRKRCVLGSPAAVEAMEFLAGLVTRGKLSPTRADVAAVTGGGVQMFIDGQLSMGTFGDWSFSDFAKKGQGLDWDIAAVPRKNGRTGSTANFRALVLNPSTRVPEASFEWLKFALTKPVQDRIPGLFNEVPARLDSAQEVYADAAKAGPPAGRRTLKDAIAATKAQPALDNVPPNEFHSIATALVNDAWDGKIPVKQAMTQAQEQITALVQRYGS